MSAPAATARPGDDFPLVLAAAYHHPDPALREGLRARIDALIEACRPRYDAATVGAALRDQRGTVLEPFDLDETDLAIAVAIGRLGFSDRIGLTRLRVVSRETLGTAGGFVLTDNLRGYYVERYALGRHRHEPSTGWFVAPAVIPRAARGTSDIGRGRATLILDAAGLRLRVPWPGDDASLPALARAVQLHSAVVGSGQTFIALGLRVDGVPGGLEVRAGSPEAIMRLTALCARGAVLALDSAPRLPERPRAFVRLAEPEERPVALPTVATVTATAPYAWVNAAPPPRIETTRAERLAIARWTSPHDSWVGDLFEELL